MWIEIREGESASFINLEQVQLMEAKRNGTMIYLVGEDTGIHFDVSYKEVVTQIRKASLCEQKIIGFGSTGK